MDGNNLKGVVINRTWFEQALELLKEPAERCSFYDALLSAGFGLEHHEPEGLAARVMYRMCLPYVMADIEKYDARCERNRANAAKKPLAATRSHSQPLAATGCERETLGSNTNINTNTNTNINTNTNTNNLSNERDRENREKFDCMGVIFSRDAANVTEEVQSFWNYYESLGWKNKNGSPVVNKVACARMWRIAGDLAGQADWRCEWHKAFKTAVITDGRVWSQVKGLRVVEDEDARAIVILTNGGERFEKLIVTNCKAQMDQLCKQYGCNRFRFQYGNQWN